MGRPGQTTVDVSAEDVRLALQAKEALELKMCGATYQEIADKLGFADESGARKCVKRTLQRINAELEHSTTEYKQLILMRNERMKFGIISDALKGDEASIKLVISLDQELAKLVGLYAPEKHDTTIQFERASDQVAYIMELMKQKKLDPDALFMSEIDEETEDGPTKE